jgi:hypothetical protein
MNFSRRKFIKAGTMLTAFAGVSLTTHLAGAQKPEGVLLDSPQRLDMLGFYDINTFYPYVNTEFRVRMAQPLERAITLVKVKGNNECFSLSFVGPHGRLIPQNTYEFSHPALGEFYMFLVPVGMRAPEKAESFEAIINRYNQYADYNTSIINRSAGASPVIDSTPTVDEPAVIYNAPVYTAPTSNGAPAFNAPSGSDPVQEASPHILMPTAAEVEDQNPAKKRNWKIKDDGIDFQWRPGDNF